MNTLKIRKLGVLSVAKMYGVICLIVGLLIGIMYGVFFIIYGFLGASMVGGNAALAVGGGSIVVGVLFMIGIPLMYGAFGFVGGAIGALLYNVFSHFVGGIEIEVDRLN